MTPCSERDYTLCVHSLREFFTAYLVGTLGTAAEALVDAAARGRGNHEALFENGGYDLSIKFMIYTHSLFAFALLRGTSKMTAANGAAPVWWRITAPG